MAKSPLLQYSSYLLNPKDHKLSLNPTPVGMNIKSSHAVPKNTSKYKLIVFNATLPTFSTPLSQSVSHAQLITYTMKNQKDVTAKSHVNNLDKSTELTSVLAQLMEKELPEFTTKLITPATAPLTFPSGTVNTVLLVQLEPNSTLRKSNAIIAQKVLLETLQATLVSLDSDQFIDEFFIYCLISFQHNFIKEPKIFK